MLILLGGIPCTGKSTWARQQDGYDVQEFDDWVLSAYGSQAAYTKALPASFDTWLKAVEAFHAEHPNVIVCDTWAEKALRQKAAEYLKPDKMIYLVEDLPVCLERNKARGLPIPQETVIQLFFSQEIPQ